MAGKEVEQLFPANQLCELMYELHQTDPSVLLSVLPHLELRLKSYDESERLQCVMLLARIFSEEDSKLAVRHGRLWQAFLGRSFY